MAAAHLPSFPGWLPSCTHSQLCKKRLHFHQLADPAACHPHHQKTTLPPPQSLETRGKKSVHLLSPNSKSVIPASICLSYLRLVEVGSPSEVYTPISCVHASVASLFLMFLFQNLQLFLYTGSFLPLADISSICKLEGGKKISWSHP